MHAGSRVRLVAPAAAFSESAFSAGLACLESQGFVLEYAEDIFSRHRYLAGDDERRFAELDEAFADPNIDAIWCVRGGYGSGRLWSRLVTLADNEAWAVGFSDISALHAHLSFCGTPSMHGANVVDLPRWSEAARSELFAFLAGTQGEARFEGQWWHGRCDKQERVRVVGGNLCVLASLAGLSPWVGERAPHDGETWCLFEEVGEAPYRIDRLLVQLRDAGYFSGISGVLLGQFINCGDAAELREIVVEVLRDEVSVIAGGYPFGHGDDSHAIPLGWPVDLLPSAAGLRVHF